MTASNRCAAASFGVNLHTVRHAYLALSRDGLVEMLGSRGTRVISDSTGSDPGDDRSLFEFVRRVVKEAESRHGVTAADLAEHIASFQPAPGERPPSVSVVECSDWQCRRHVDEIVHRWNVDAHPHPIDTDQQPDTEIVVATWFHYNDVRRRWPGLLHRVEFVTIRPDLSALPDLAAEMWWVVERDEATVGAVAGDLTALLAEEPRQIRSHVTSDPAAAVRSLPGDDPILFAPRVWADLDETTRDHPRAFELRYVFDTQELQAVAERHRWRPRTHTTPEEATRS